MTRGKKLLTDAHLAKIEPHIPTIETSRKGGRPRVSNRICFEAFLWILKSGAPWRMLPDCYPNPATVWRRLRDWEQEL